MDKVRELVAIRDEKGLTLKSKWMAGLMTKLLLWPKKLVRLFFVAGPMSLREMSNERVQTLRKQLD